jgi:hypothetical protein
MLKVIQHFSKHCSCHLQGECVLVDKSDWWSRRVGSYPIGDKHTWMRKRGDERLFPSSPLFGVVVTRGLLETILKHFANFFMNVKFKVTKYKQVTLQKVNYDLRGRK